MAKGQIAIVGMDTVGISLALSLKRALPESNLVIIDRSGGRLREAGKFAKFEQTATNVASGCRGAALIILNVPLSQLREAFTSIGPQLIADAVVLVLAPVAAAADAWAAELLPQSAHFMSCHLVLHPEQAARTQPDADLFHGAVLCMQPAPQTDGGVIKIGGDLARALGARPYYLSAAELDGMLAGVEGLPYLLSALGALTAMQSEAWPELSVVAGPLFAQITQPMLEPQYAQGAGVQLNRAEVLRWLAVFQANLRDVRRVIEAGQAQEISKIFEELERKRIEWLNSRPIRAWTDTDSLPPSGMDYQRPNPLLPHWGVKT
jgi:prephenate dehydrogenase